MAKDRPPAFQFYVRDYLSSMAVCAMTPEERGGYVHLLCHAWLQDEPGVLPADEAILAGLSGLGARWADCRPGILRAFRGETRNGAPVHVQPRLMAEREAQASRREKAAKGARATNDARWSSVASESLGGRSSVALQSASATALEESKQESTPPAPPLADASPTVFELPLRSGEPYPVRQADVARWEKLYPDLLIVDTLREQAAWLESNPTRRKTRRGMPRFINAWLLREQNTPPPTERFRDGPQARRT